MFYYYSTKKEQDGNSWLQYYLPKQMYSIRMISAINQCTGSQRALYCYLFNTAQGTSKMKVHFPIAIRMQMVECGSF